MADFAQMIYGTAQNVAQNEGVGAADQYQKASELALKAEQNAQANNTQIRKLYEYIGNAKNNNTAGDRNRYLKSALGYRNMMGISPDEVPDDHIAGFASDENMGRLYSLRMSVARGDMSVEQAAQIARDPEALAKTNPIPLDATPADQSDWDTAQKEFLDRQSQEKQAQARANATAAKGDAMQGRFETASRQKLAREATTLGLPGLKTSMNKVDAAVPGGLDGFKAGTALPGITGPDARLPVTRLKGKALELRQAAEGVKNQLLKLASGQAVTPGEAVRMLNEIGMSATLGEDKVIRDIVFRGVSSPDAFINGMKNARDKIGSVENTYRRAYGKDVYDEVVGTPVGSKDAGGDSFTLSNGKAYPKAQLEKFLSLYPNDSKVPEIKKLLGVK